jgi:chromosome segregation ATPase
MTSQRHLFLLAGGLSALLFACASDPNKRASDAHDAELEAQRKEQQAHAGERSDARVRSAEAQRDGTEARATGSEATQDRTSAYAELTEARATHRAKATERFEKLDARTQELKALVGKAGGKASTASRDALKTVDTQRAMVAGSLRDLPTVTNDAWSGAKSRLDEQIGTLDGLVKRAADEVDAFKK